MHLSVTGLVIRRFPIDNGRVLWLFTKERGLITVFANGVMNPKKGMAAGTDLFAHGTYELFYYKEKYSLNSIESQKLFMGLSNDLSALAVASYIAELTAVIAPKELGDEEMYRLCLNVLHFLNKGEKNFYLLKAIYELRSMMLAGFMPDLVSCYTCGAFKEDNPFYLSVSEGILYCEDCKHTATSELTFIPPAVLAAMRHIIYSDMNRLFSFTLPEEMIRVLTKVCQDFVLYHTEKRFNTVEFMRTIGMLD